MTSPNVELALRLSDRVYVLDQGTVVHEATAQALLADPETQQRYCSI